MLIKKNQILERTLDAIGVVFSTAFACSIALFLLANMGAAARALHLLP